MEKPSNDFNETPEYLSFQLKKCIEEDYINQSNLPTYTISDVDNLFEDFNHELQVLKEFDFSDRLESEIEGDFENAFLALAEIKSFIVDLENKTKKQSRLVDVSFANLKQSLIDFMNDEIHKNN